MKRARIEEPVASSSSGQGSGSSAVPSGRGSTSEPHVHQSKISRKIRACQQCQNRKIKCDIEQGQSRCARCTRMGLECVINKSLQTLLDDENQWKKEMEQQLRSLQAAMSQVQRMLNIPPPNPQHQQHQQLPQQQQQQQQHLHDIPSVGSGATHSSAFDNSPSLSGMHGSPAGPSPSRPPEITAMTRENSPETAHPRIKEDQAIVDAPMASLFEVTKLRNIRSDPGSRADALLAARRSGEPDFIAQGRVPLAEAEQLFARFRGTLNAYLWGGVALLHDNLLSARQSSPLLVAAILAVTALHAQDEGVSFDRCYPVFLDLASQCMFQRYHTLDDVRGLCIGAFWLSDVSWKLSGLAVRIATELNLHQFCAKALRDEPDHVEKARLWYFLYVCDHHFSIAYGRPPVIPEDVTISRHESFLQLPGIRQADFRLHSQVAIFVILSRAYHTFGPDRSRLVANDEFEALRRYESDMGHWRRMWEPRLVPDPNISQYPAKGVKLHYHFARLQIFSVCLRGLTPTDQFLMSPERRSFIDSAISSASAALRLILNDPDMRRAVIGVPLYLLTAMAYAAIFLMKVQSEWKAAEFNISFSEVVTLIEATVSLLNDSQACVRHVAHFLGKGLNTMLEKFKEREAMLQAQAQQQQNEQFVQQQGWAAQDAQQGWNNWMLGGAPEVEPFGIGAEYYPLGILDVLGSQMPG
ncbi:conserved hypothetical protein [Verticillium alfalfae VaMs.102]|uniref:Zn(2)-C6 fungal-type domain-containing protein n=1 Tax=Verticillium alfalfae (strain VaMs.102 / ATCC MYA-4576 / FGSC 10136) TaxID=526221 RepID=C9SN42_VERA1|nr:conserved hypothetical protein [Verticillium alfalfae VaMs.102]EEY20207.1 conserved hypothetical protein [Verticillium alfalfae VaMs.102]